MSDPRFSVRSVVKLNVDAVGRLLAQGRYIHDIPTFTLSGVAYDYLTPVIEGHPEAVRSWEYGKYRELRLPCPS